MKTLQSTGLFIPPNLLALKLALTAEIAGVFNGVKVALQESDAIAGDERPQTSVSGIVCISVYPSPRRYYGPSQHPDSVVFFLLTVDEEANKPSARRLSSRDQ